MLTVMLRFDSNISMSLFSFWAPECASYLPGFSFSSFMSTALWTRDGASYRHLVDSGVYVSEARGCSFQA